MAFLEATWHGLIRRSAKGPIWRLSLSAGRSIRAAAPIGCGFIALLVSVHVSGEGLSGSGMAAKNAGNLDLSHESLRRLDRSCTLCHQVDEAFSHPTGITPAMAVPAQFPLVGNAIGCITCHEGETSRDHANSPNEIRVQLRLNPGERTLCAACHEPFGMTRADAHASAISMAHPGGVTIRGDWGFNSNDQKHLDASQSGYNCRACHDGSIASDVGHTRDELFGFDRFRPGGGGHPVGVEYRMTTPEDVDGELRSASELDPRIRLFDNKVSCQSCHSLYSVRPDYLVMSNDRSALCLSCHLY